MTGRDYYNCVTAVSHDNIYIHNVWSMWQSCFINILGGTSRWLVAVLLIVLCNDTPVNVVFNYLQFTQIEKCPKLQFHVFTVDNLNGISVCF